ncbi:hypothetical protein PGT21_007979 [Puccinia graminis f. sp. tritici]|uniref:Uncharacterized protein n=1 Tax=Puccinia graminis f. sp. tritici TaxID=56615 RepID=A0A5B0N3T4_PUCGR|nr:hypothetical protein PGT21_007979 [Puccinia graminis f. sp. tritici]KAA1133506.1 hypothetical protein PGTUg99_019911 [Puccinia graminis f. sp. tritici]
MAGAPSRAKHAPPVSSPLVTPSRRRNRRVKFGAPQCRPKTSTKVRLAYAPTFPIITASASHSYRLIARGPLSPIIRLNPTQKSLREDVLNRVYPVAIPRPTPTPTPTPLRPTPLKRRRADDDDQGPPKKRRK